LAESGAVATALPAIWVDADACPVAVREMLYRAAERCQRQVTLVANRMIANGNRPNVRCMVVEAGFDKADDEIAERVQANDLVVTADIPLADAVIKRGALALDPRGELHTKESIGARLNMRDFLDTLRASGMDTGGSPPYGSKDKQRFANHLDRWLTSTSD
jgi:hypothetical protein